MAELVSEEEVRLVMCHDIIGLGCSRGLDLSDVMVTSWHVDGLDIHVSLIMITTCIFDKIR